MAQPKLTLTAGKAAVEGGVNGIFTIAFNAPAPVGGLQGHFKTAGSSATAASD